MPPGNARPDLPTVLATGLLLGPVLAGLAGTLLPAFGYLPVLGFDTLNLDAFRQLVATPGLSRSAALSFGTGLATSLLSLAIVLLFTAGWSGTKTFRRLSRFLSPLLSVPHAAAAIGLAFLIAPSGFLVRLLSPWATGWSRPPDILILQDPYGLSLTFALVAKEVPFLFLMTLAALNRPHVQEYAKAARSLGYGRVAGFLTAVLPQIYPLIRLPMLAVIAYATSVVDVAEILGPTTPPPLAPRLVQWMNDPDLAKRLMASAGTLLQLAVSAAALLVYLVLEKAVSAVTTASSTRGWRFRRDRALRGAGLVLMALVAAAMVLSMGLLGLWSVAKSWWFPAALPQRWDAARAGDAIGMGGPALLATVLLAIAAAFAATALTLWLLETRNTHQKNRSRRLNALFFMPLLIPQIGFLFGLNMLFLVMGLNGSFFAVLLAHLVFVFPYAYLALSDPWYRLDPRYTKAASSLGASQARIFWQVRFPLLLRPVLVTFAVAAAVSVGQYLPTLLIGAGRIVTVTTESVALASGGNRQVAAVYAVLQLMIPLAGFSLAALIPSLVYRNRTAMGVSRT
ncbi:ABC transporter permease [Roseibium aggregatum]|uniref:ABC transporter permease subunit n=1 Tax=Roseibium aggregatum TaxID=187304 RepID=A0A939EAF8_9HYPH|nr:ABC transporter permease subunit [Roseibium aggregatum]MBN9668824.1 ABC transporter permease subunit [Roseibium aggregatum]